MARPSKYRSEYAEQAYKFCLLGATDAKLGEFFDVDEATINRWKEAHAEFCESIKRGKAIADAEIAHSLFQRAKGYSHEAVKIFNNQGEIIVEPYVEHYPPDTGAAMAWLKNRQSALWRDRIEKVVYVDPKTLTDKELKELIDNGA